MAFDASIEPEDRDKLYLQRAKDRLMRGWCQSTLYDGKNVCLVGALLCGVCDTEQPVTGTVSDEMLDRLSQHLGFGNAQEAIRFNDFPARRKAEVLERFDCAIEGRPQKRDTTPDYMRSQVIGCGCAACKAGGFSLKPAKPSAEMMQQMAAYQAAFEKSMREKMTAIMVTQPGVGYFAEPSYFAEPAKAPKRQPIKNFFSDLLTI